MDAGIHRLLSFYSDYKHLATVCFYGEAEGRLEFVGNQSLKDLVTGQVEGLRERKKRETRQRISDTATEMFLENGFDSVKVADIAKACGVSEKTVYNYFPTKEGLLLDREDDIAEALQRELGPEAKIASPVDAAVGILTTTLDQVHGYWVSAAADDGRMVGMQRFFNLFTETPSLRAAQFDMMNRLTNVAARALAERAGLDEQDPEPQMAAAALLGLWRVQFQSMHHYANGDYSPDEAREHIATDVERAARLIESGLWSFGALMQSGSNRDQLKAAGDAAQKGARQVISAIRQAHRAWKQMEAEQKNRQGT